MFRINSLSVVSLIKVLKNETNLILPNTSKQYINFTFIMLNENFSKCLLFKKNQLNSVVITRFILNKALNLRFGCFDYVLKNILFQSCFILKSNVEVNYKVIGIAKIDFKTEIQKILLKKTRHKTLRG